MPVSRELARACALTRHPSLIFQTALTLGLAGCSAGTAGLGTTDDTAAVSPTNPSTALAEPSPLCINEFMPRNETAWQDEGGDHPDWIELHNPGAAPVSLQGWFISDDPDRAYEWALDSTLSVPAGGHMVLIADNQPQLGPEHLPFALSETGEGVSLRRSDGVGEALRFGTVIADYSWARQPDCCPDPEQCMTQQLGGTPGASNGGGRR